jgi:FMN-dependent NADH-azoreductase
MYNFTISSPLKAWIDHVARAGRTFRYTADGPIGLLTGKKVFVASATGGIYGGESPARAMNFQEPYLRAILGFMGLNDVTFVRLEGLSISPEAAAKGWSSVHAQIAAVVPQALAA